jgi:hypothetical protein
MMIDAPPTGDANVTVNVAGGATATQGVDYDFTTNGNFAAPSNALTFASGSAASKTITIRIYDDAEVEGNETFTLTYSLSGSTNAVAAPNFQTNVFTIADNDVGPAGPFAANYTLGTYTLDLTNSSPLRSNKQKHRMEGLFTAAEFNAAGLTNAASMTSMNIRVGTKNSTQPYTGLTISMANTTATNLSTGFISASFTQVYSATYTSVAGNNTFTFTTPFAWDGTSNVLVQVCFDNAPAAADALADVVEGNAPLGTGIRASTYSDYSSGATAGCSLAAAFVSDNRFNATFGANGGNPIESVLNNNRTEYLSSNGTYYFYTTPNGNIISKINAASSSLGCVNANIFEAGNTWQSFLGGLRSQKVFDIAPATNPGAT